MKNYRAAHLQYLPFFMLTPGVLLGRCIFFDPAFLGLLEEYIFMASPIFTGLLSVI